MLHIENVHNLLVNNICHNPFLSTLQTVFYHLNRSAVNIQSNFYLKDFLILLVVENLHTSNS